MVIVLMESCLQFFDETPQFFFSDMKEELIGQEFDLGSWRLLYFELGSLV